MTVLAIHGDMAVGKTTLLNKIKVFHADWYVDLEDIHSVLDQVKNLDKNNFHDFIETQHCFLEHEKNRISKLKNHQKVIMDYSIEEVVFQTTQMFNQKYKLCPFESVKSILNDVNQFYVDRILYLHGSKDILEARKNMDSKRQRKSFDVYMDTLYPKKLEWFLNLPHVDVIHTDGMSPEEVYLQAVEWMSQNS